MVSCGASQFNLTDRIGSDSCGLSQRNVQNKTSLSYLMESFASDCPMSKAVNFATCQPAINYSGSHQMGMGGCNVDANSMLHIRDLSRDKCKVSLWQRPFATVPYLGRGRSNHLVESQLRKGELGILAAKAKSSHPDSEVSYLRYTTTPLIPQLQADVDNSSRKIEEDAAGGWIRGGLPSRALERGREYVASSEPSAERLANMQKPWCEN